MPKEQARLLMVDSDTAACEFVNDLASLYNYEIHACSQAEEALDLIEQMDFDALLIGTDIDGGGFLLSQSIRSLPEYEDTPVTFITSQESDPLTLMEAQFYGGLFLHQKPFNEVELLAQLSTMVRIKLLQDELKARMRELDRLASTDVLTGLYNRRMFFIRFEEELARARRNQSGFCLVYIDIDHFKLTNDTYGHQAGDEILQRVSTSMSEHLRRSDVLGRIGGEEFAVLLPDTFAPAGEMISERLRTDVEGAEITYAGQVIPTTISLGVFSVATPGALSIDQLIRQADEALYEAKHTGRNKVVMRLHQDTAVN
jgi:two-component system, cell cycle response regulator